MFEDIYNNLKDFKNIGVSEISASENYYREEIIKLSKKICEDEGE